MAAAVDLRLAADQLGAQSRDLHALLRGFDPTAGIGQQRQVGPQAQVVARQLQHRIDQRVSGPGERDVQTQLELGVAADAGQGQCVASPGTEWRGVEVAQQVGQRAADLAFDLQQGARRQLADSPLHLGQFQPPQLAASLLKLHRVAIEHQLAADARERWPGRFPGRLLTHREHRRHRRERQVLHLAGDLELAIAAVDIGKIP